MATAKLWWNGSAWSTSEAYWLNGNTWGSGTPCYILYTAQVIAYDDGTLGFKGTMEPNGAGASYALEGTKTYKVEGNTLTTFSNGNRSRNVALSVGAYPATLAYSGNVSVVKYSGGAQYGNPWKSSGSTSITNPFVTITYSANGATFATQTACVGASMNIPETVPTKTNHTFLGWATSASAHVQDYNAGGEITVSSDTTLYAVWEPCVFISADEGVTITFDGVAYTNTTATVGKTWGAEYALTVSPNVGFIIKTQSHADGNVEIDADEITISATSQRVGCHIDDGDDFVQAVMYVDNGVSYDMVQAYVDNGVSWELVY